jgi:Zn-finger nucleic acid-binding protein
MCGAAAATESSACSFCGSRLATVACPSCFGMMITGSRFCSHCGSSSSRTEGTRDTAASCPRCRLEMEFVTIGAAELTECKNCGGIWVEIADFEKICADSEQQSAVLGAASLDVVKSVDSSESNKVRYLPCPKCTNLMNRINFARCSGVIVDVCKGHGTWFDRDELRRIVGFIRGGGLDAARNREKREIEEERRALAQERLATSVIHPAIGFEEIDSNTIALGAARGLLKFLLD